MLSEVELIDVLKSQLDRAELDIERLAHLIREAYRDTSNIELKDQVEDTFRELKLDL